MSCSRTQRSDAGEARTLKFVESTQVCTQTKHNIQCSPFIMLLLGSIGMDHKRILLYRDNFTKEW